jgi:predicted RNase H-like nuclease (RuvC/YqgF family)
MQKQIEELIKENNKLKKSSNVHTLDENEKVKEKLKQSEHSLHLSTEKIKEKDEKVRELEKTLQNSCNAIDTLKGIFLFINDT